MSKKLRNVYSGARASVSTSMLRSLCFVLVEQQIKTMDICPRFEVMKV